MKQVLPNPLYYLDNFQLVLDWVSERYDDVLVDEERAFIADFSNMPPSSKALFVRMVMRKGDYFRQNKLSYPEIGDTQQAMLPLINAGWIEPDPALTLNQLLDLLQKPEIVVAFSLTAPYKQLRKAEQLEYLRNRGDESKPYSAWYPASGETVVHIGNKALCDRLRLIFFGNCYQDWSEFVLSDLGIYRYESIPFSAESRGFQTRRDVEDYIALQACRDLLHREEPIPLVLEELAKTVSENDWINRRRDKLLFQMGQQAEKQREWDLALAIYAMSHYPGTRLRTIRVLEKTGQSSAALQRLNDALADPESDAEFQQLQRSAPRLNRKLGLQKPVTPAIANVDIIELRLPYPMTSFYVEGVVKDHLTQDNAPVYYVENTLINALFGLLCWKAIFKPIPGAFFHPFHRASNSDSDHYSSNARARNGILLFGEPGNGKTYFVQALAGEMGLPLISITYGDVASKWVNDTTQAVMKVFQDAKAQAPCVLFFDEIDSFISKRDNSMGTADETNKTTNTILTEIVNLRTEGIVFVGATNFLDRLDQAAIREGRFDFKIEVSPPDEAARCQILIDSFRQLMDQSCYLPRDVQNIAKRWEGYSVKRIQAVGEEIAAMDQEEQIVAVTSRHLMVAMRKVQGRKGKLPEATKNLDQLILPDKLRQKLNTIATRMEDFARVEELGGTVPTGLLFFGGPGTGKTETARSLAKASAYAFISTTGNDLINDSREIDRILAEAKDIRPCIIFIDEADDILANRKNSNVTSVTNKLLTAMDGANGKVKDIVYIAATNHPDHIDPAALRGGRFTEKIYFPLPDEAGRTEFIKQWMAQSKAQFDPVLTPELIATIIRDDISISNLSAILQEAANHMIGRNNQDGMDIVMAADLEEAKRTILG